MINAILGAPVIARVIRPVAAVQLPAVYCYVVSCTTASCAIFTLLFDFMLDTGLKLFFVKSDI